MYGRPFLISQPAGQVCMPCRACRAPPMAAVAARRGLYGIGCFARLPLLALFACCRSARAAIASSIGFIAPVVVVAFTGCSQRDDVLGTHGSRSRRWLEASGLIGWQYLLERKRRIDAESLPFVWCDGAAVAPTDAL